MKKVLFVLTVALLVSISLYSSDYVDAKMKNFVDSLKSEEYGDGIVELLKDSALEEKVLNVSQTKTNWINQFIQIKSLYGEYISYEKVGTKKLGSLETTIYFVYCDIYPIQIMITEYNNGRKIDIINMEFDDQVLNTLNTLGEFN